MQEWVLFLKTNKQKKPVDFCILYSLLSVVSHDYRALSSFWHFAEGQGQQWGKLRLQVLDLPGALSSPGHSLPLFRFLVIQGSTLPHINQGQFCGVVQVLSSLGFFLLAFCLFESCKQSVENNQESSRHPCQLGMFSGDSGSAQMLHSDELDCLQESR